MSTFDRLLRHSVTIERVSEGPLDEYGQPSRSFAPLATVRARIEPRKTREEVTTHGGGTVMADYRIFMRPTDVTSPDEIVHGPDRYQVLAVHDAGGAGHHYEIDARRITAA